MAAVSVFVDDAILGRLPLVCAKTGEPADLVIRMQRPVGRGLSWAAVLFLLGPLGIVAFVVLMIMAPGQEYLTVRVPQTTAAYQREKQLERLRLTAVAAAVLVPVAGLLSLRMFALMWLLAGIGFLAAGVAFHFMLGRQAIGISLDGSRRWVTLTNVHPAFARAADFKEAAGRPGR